MVTGGSAGATSTGLASFLRASDFASVDGGTFFFRREGVRHRWNFRLRGDRRQRAAGFDGCQRSF